MDAASFGVSEVFLMPIDFARKPDRPAAMPAGVFNFCLYTESNAGQDTLSVEGFCQITRPHHKLFCEFMHDRNILQLRGQHILYIVRMTSHNDALCPVKHSYCLKHVFCCL